MSDVTPMPNEPTSEPFALEVNIGLRCYTSPEGKEYPIESGVLLALALQQAALEAAEGMEEAGVRTSSTTAEDLVQRWKEEASQKIQTFNQRYGQVKVSG